MNMFFLHKSITILYIVNAALFSLISLANAKVLLPDKTLAAQMTRVNTIYEIKDVFDLHGQSLRIPERCVLSFKGGEICNGTIEGNNTIIRNNNNSTIFLNVQFKGSWNVKEGRPEWFGAVGDGINDDRDAVQNAIDVCNTIVLENNYLIHNAPFDYSKYNPIPEDELIYYKDVLAQKNRCPDSKLTPLYLPSNKTFIVSGLLKAYSPLGNLIEIRGNNTVITGGGIISGSGIVNTVNVYSGKPSYSITEWESALIYIEGSNNRIDGITIKDPTRMGISIYDYFSKDNVICNCTIGGGLKAHTETVETCSFTGLHGIYARGTNTVVKENVFKRLDGRTVYSSLYCNYTTTNVPSIDKRTELHTTFENNVVEDALSHAVYSYAKNLKIIGNSIRADQTALQLFNGHQFVDGNSIFCNDGSSAIYVSGENQIITNNKLYNVGRYAVRCAGYYNGSCDNAYVANNYIEKLMVPFSDDQPKTSPAITFESTAFRDNNLNLSKITCENNTIICKGESQSARTIPIVGIIAIYGDSNTTIEQIIIRNNTVLNSNVADNIAITLMNPVKKGRAIIEGNKCVNDCQLISTTPSEPILLLRGVNLAVVRNNHFEQRSTMGTAFELTDVGKIEFSDNTLIANLNAKSDFYTTTNGTSLSIDGSNIINGQPTERLLTVPSKSTAPITFPCSLPTGKWDMEIVPINRAARKAERDNPLKLFESDINGVKLGHETATKRKTKYKVRVIYK